MIDRTLLNYIQPDDYDSWVKVGMALKHENEPFEVFDEWSSHSTKYKGSADCRAKWESFNRDGGIVVTGGTIYALAVQGGYRPDDNELDIHSLVLDEAIIDPAFVSTESVPGLPKKYKPEGDLLEYLTTLFQGSEFVGYCTAFRYDNEKERWLPERTVYRATADHLISELRNGKTIEQTVGTLNKDAGAYIRFNPLDGHGENNGNVTRWKYCLIENDTMPVDRQYSLLKALNLPIAFIVNSGGKSLHAITRVDAENAQQYRQRVQEIYSYCRKNGYSPDENDKNESRFSRMPGVKRGDKWQYIVARNIGPSSYQDFIDWCEEQNDDLPPDTNLADVWDNLPPLKEELIPGILRVGHKMLVAGPSKAGKSFLLIDLAISLAEGVEWLGMRCKQGKVCYVNLELDGDSCFRRFKDIYEKRKLPPVNVKNITIWNLRGRSVPLEKLAPRLIRRFKEQGYEAVIVDPIYKVLGDRDENSAGDMASFCNEFDRIATDMGVATIYCHHHSKGASDKYANAADRSSGSGVFARDPDAILDLQELKVTDIADKYREQVKDASETLTAWEITSTLREFAPMKPIRVWFDYPYHAPDEWNFLGNANYSRSGAKGAAHEEEAETPQTIFNYCVLDQEEKNATTIEKWLENSNRKAKPWNDREVAFKKEAPFECVLKNTYLVVRGTLEFWLDGKHFYRPAYEDANGNTIHFKEVTDGTD